MFSLSACVCECDSEALNCRVVSLSIVCEQKNKKIKTKASYGDNDSDSEASGALHESVYSHKSPGFITLHTGSCLLSGRQKLCLCMKSSLFPDMRHKNQRLSDDVLLL